MPLALTPARLWRNRWQTLRDDLQRVSVLLAEEVIQAQPGLDGRYNVLLSPLATELEDMRAAAPTDDATVSAEQWTALTDLSQRIRLVVISQLELLGGVAIAGGLTLSEGGEGQGLDEGLLALAEEWLNDRREPLGLERNLTVLAGRGDILELDTGVVRLPFLDWDLWHVPLLGRALGLLASAPGSDPFERAFDDAVKPLVQSVEQLYFSLPGETPAELDRLLPAVQERWRAFEFADSEAARNEMRAAHRTALADLAADQRLFLSDMLADIFATAIFGPVYPMAVFALELDYRDPETAAIAQGRRTGDPASARVLPSATVRAATLLATLNALENERERPAYETGPFEPVRQRLTAMWSDAMDGLRRRNHLVEELTRWQPWVDRLYREVVRKLARPAVVQTLDAWPASQRWADMLGGQHPPEGGRPPLTVLLTALWWRRLHCPELDDEMLEAAARIQAGQPFLARQRPPAAPLRVVAVARAGRLAQRWQRLSAILEDERIPAADRTAVAGRFYRLMSEQVYDLDLVDTLLAETTISRGVWGRIGQLAEAADPILRESLEFLGGLLVYHAQLDREPAALISDLPDQTAGPSICDLADDILRDYTRRTGVNWSARTVLGPNPFLSIIADVIRVRFPDWSIWHLPLMAHEFGHLVALATPAFRDYQAEQYERALKDHPAAAARRRHLDEFFADLFAVYTIGPSFAADAILYQFSPGEAFAQRGIHPSHDERVQAIMLALRQMNEATQRFVGDPGDYGPVIADLERVWQTAVDSAGVRPVDEAFHHEQLKLSLRWARKLYQMIDQFYRLGASYRPADWQFAREVGARLVAPAQPKLADLQQMAAAGRRRGLPLRDLLNGLWAARLFDIHSPNDLQRLERLAYQLGSEHWASLQSADK